MTMLRLVSFGMDLHWARRSGSAAAGAAAAAPAAAAPAGAIAAAAPASALSLRKAERRLTDQPLPGTRTHAIRRCMSF
jgi:hypothetical protein